MFPRTRRLLETFGLIGSHLETIIYDSYRQGWEDACSYYGKNQLVADARAMDARAHEFASRARGVVG